MDDWIELDLASIGEIVSGGTPSTSRPEFWQGGIAWITPNDLSRISTPFMKSSARTVSDLGVKNSSAKLIPKGSLVVSSRAPIGYAAIVTVDYTTNQGCKSVAFFKEHEPLFHYYNFLFNVNKVKEKGEGTTFAEISKSALSKIKFNLPKNRSEQSIIATILSTVDAAIEKTEQLIAKYERIKTGLMQDLLTRGIDEQGNIRSEETHAFKDSPLGRIPVEWEIKPLGEECYVTKLAGFEFSNYFDYTEDGEIIALRALNIKNEKLDLTNIQRIAKSVSDMLTRSKLYEGDVLITYIGAYIGDILQIKENDKYHLAPNIAKIVPGEKITSDFLEIYLRSYAVQSQMKNSTATTATPSLTMGQIRNLTIAFPKDENEQDRITEIYNQTNLVLSECKQELQLQTSLKTALMQDLLTGKVRVDSLLKENA